MGCVTSYWGQMTIEALLDKGANVHAVSADGKTALKMLADYPYINIVGDPGTDGARKTLLILADAGVFKGQAPPVHLLPALGLALSERADS
jgi:hypothetical protein